MRKVNIDIANFNLTFGDKESPLLTYFEEFLYPAFTSEIIREVDDTRYMFKSVELIETKKV